MNEFLGALWWLVVSLALLVTFHEFGHYWVARRCGVRVLRFSIGFGPALYSRRTRSGTEFVIAAIPLGGYVRMLDESDGFAVHPSERAAAFNHKSVWQRLAIVAAGPIANLLLCVALLWAMFLIGRENYAPVIGQTSGIAAEAGFKPTERIIAIEGQSITTWEDAYSLIIPAALDKRDIELQIQDEDGDMRLRILPLSRLPEAFEQSQAFQEIGIVWHFSIGTPQVVEVRQGSAADGLLQKGDLILALDGQRIQSGEQLAPLVQRLGNSDGMGMIDIERDGHRFALEIHPQRITTSDGTFGPWLLGVETQTVGPPYDVIQHFGPVAAVPMALKQMKKITDSMVDMLKRIVTGRALIKENLAGPITIARAANAFAHRGADWFLYFLALLSLSLAVLNLLPIPVLDGGRILYYFIEACAIVIGSVALWFVKRLLNPNLDGRRVLYYLIDRAKRSPFVENIAIAGQYLGLAFLFGLIGLVIYNDILRLMPK